MLRQLGHSSIREDTTRESILAAICERLRDREAIDLVRKRIATELGGYIRRVEAERAEHRERLKRIEERIRGLIDFIADGERSEYIISTLRDLEDHAKLEKFEIERLDSELQQPVRLPSIDELSAIALDLSERLTRDPVTGRTLLQRWLGNGQIRITRREDGSWIANGELLPLVVISADKRRNHFGQTDQPGQSGTTVVAGAGFEPGFGDLTNDRYSVVLQSFPVVALPSSFR